MIDYESFGESLTWLDPRWKGRLSFGGWALTAGSRMEGHWRVPG